MYQSGLLQARPLARLLHFKGAVWASRAGSVAIDAVGLIVLFYYMFLPAFLAVMVMNIALKGRTPGKQIFGLQILDFRTGMPASMKRIFLREIIGKALLPAGFPALLFAFLAAAVPEGDPGPEDMWGAIYLLLTMGVFAVYFAGGYAVMFFDRDQRTLWDHLAGTVIRPLPEPNLASGRSRG